MMAAFVRILFEGVNNLLDGLFGGLEKSAKKSPEMRKALREAKAAAKSTLSEQQAWLDAAKTAKSDEAMPSGPSPLSSGGTPETIDTGVHQNVGVLKNPHVAGALKNVYADYRFNQYEKKGFLSECYRQRDERLKGLSGA